MIAEVAAMVAAKPPRPSRDPPHNSITSLTPAGYRWNNSPRRSPLPAADRTPRRR
jgi:hypothetical protein